MAGLGQQWVKDGDVCLDSFNVGSATNSRSWTDVTDLLVPELQRCVPVWLDYAVRGGPFREDLLLSEALHHDTGRRSSKSPIRP